MYLLNKLANAFCSVCIGEVSGYDLHEVISDHKRQNLANFFAIDVATA